MSSILDALEKSERERNQQHVPSYSTMQPPEERGLPTKPIFLVLIALLLCAVAAFVVYLQLSSPSIDGQNKPLAALSDQSSSIDGVDGVINFTELSDADKATLPDLHINVMSVSADAERSFVMLGETMYREGQKVVSGLTLSNIHQGYILLDYNGRVLRKDL